MEPTVVAGEQSHLLDRMADMALAGGGSLVVEVTERRLGDDIGALLRFTDEVRARGWALAIDDLGQSPPHWR